MRIGLISDTHNHLDEKVYKYFENVDEIWHAGDIGRIDLLNKLQEFKPTKAVYGNIDGHDVRIAAPEIQSFVVGGLRVLMIHIGGKPSKYTKQARELIDTYSPDIYVCGHSHILRVMTDDRNRNLLFLNPGAAGIVGFHKVKTLLRFEINGGQVGNMQAIELGPRAQKKQT